MVGSISARCLTILRWSFTNEGTSSRRAQATHVSRASSVSPWGSLKTVRSPFFEVVGASERGVGLNDPRGLGALALGQVLRVLPERVARVLDRDGPASAAPTFV